MDSGLTAGWRDFRPSGWSTDSSITTEETAQNTTSGLDPTTAEYNYRYGSSGDWEGWQDVESYDAGQDTTDPVTLYADAIAYTGESQTAFQVQFRIENYASNLMTSTVHSVRVDNVPPSGSIAAPLRSMMATAGRTAPA